jgi:acetylornithine aminotransferase
MRNSDSCLLRYPGYDLPLPTIVRADNCRLTDANGNRYVDLESGVWCTAIGHSHPRILKVLNDQAARIAHTGFSYAHPVAEQAARAILSLHDFGDGRAVLLCSGSEAVEYGVRALQSISSRPMLLTMADSYFGAYGAAHLRKAEQWFGFDWMPCPRCENDGDGCDRCQRWETIPFDQIGGFVFEPGSSSGLVRFPPEKLVRSIVNEIKASGGWVMVNEVTTGMGRTGKWFGYEHYGIKPDIVAMGKGLGNGYPVSAAAVSAGVAAALADAPIAYAQSHQNDPLGAAVALEVIRVIREENLVERGRQLGVMLMDGLEAIRARTGRIEQVRGRGLMAAMDLNDDGDAEYAGSVQQALIESGFVLARRPGLNTLRVDPALTIEREDLDHFLAVFEFILGDGANCCQK